jgi:N-acyl amino acid synthase of PEP-CTERM/exosortase system
MQNDLIDAFDEYFEIITVNSPELLEESFRLRHTVLCIEARLPGFNVEDYPDGRETDEFDHHSHHLLLKHRPSNSFIGGARLIRPDPLNLQAPLPIEQHTLIDSELLDTNNLSRQNAAEISRFLLLGKYSRRREERRRSPDWLSNEQRDQDGNRRRFPHPMLAIAVGIIRTCIQHNITHWFSVMEPALNRLLGLYDLQLDPIGPLANYHGPRRPYYADIRKVLERMHTNNPQVWELVTDRGEIQPTLPGAVLNASIVAEHGN